jgi:CBS domain-containing protein
MTRAVARAMADHKYGCAVVTDGRGHLLGLFTTTDALRLLADGDSHQAIGSVITDHRD